jgi:hypothetical protein
MLRGPGRNRAPRVIEPAPCPPRLSRGGGRAGEWASLGVGRAPVRGPRWAWGARRPGRNPVGDLLRYANKIAQTPRHATAPGASAEAAAAARGLAGGVGARRPDRNRVGDLLRYANKIAQTPRHAQPRPRPRRPPPAPPPARGERTPRGGVDRAPRRSSSRGGGRDHPRPVPSPRRAHTARGVDRAPRRSSSRGGGGAHAAPRWRASSAQLR